MTWCKQSVVLLASLLCLAGEASGEETWPPPLPETPWFSGAKTPGQRGAWREDSVKKLSASLLPAVVMVSVQARGSGGSQGSGFFINPEGYLVTNHHVVSSAGEVRVVLHDGRERLARVVARDTITDLAVLYVKKRPGERFAHLTLGDSDNVRVGDWSVALGAPLRFEGSVTAGVVSSVNRKGSRPKKSTPLKSYVQFDTAINPGSSGGPLVNTRGQVIGVVTAMRKDGQALGFAIPVNRLTRVLPRLIAGRSVKRASIGVDVQDVTVALGRSVGIAARGAMISKLNVGSAGAKAGLEVGDIVKTFDGEVVEDGGGLMWLAATSEQGRAVSVSVLRGGVEREVQVSPSRPVSMSVRRSMSSAIKRAGVEVVAGVGVAQPSPAVREALGYGDRRGVLVVFVAKASPAYVSGLRSLMWVERVGDAQVASPTQFNALLESALRERGAVRMLTHEQDVVRWLAWEERVGIGTGD